MRGFLPTFVSGCGVLALFLVRAVVGIAFILHGWPKIQNRPSWVNAIGENVPPLLQALAVPVEFGGGIALILGLLTPLAALAIVCQMLAALFLVHFPMRQPFVAATGGARYKLPLVSGDHFYWYCWGPAGGPWTHSYSATIVRVPTQWQTGRTT